MRHHYIAVNCTDGSFSYFNNHPDWKPVCKENGLVFFCKKISSETESLIRDFSVAQYAEEEAWLSEKAQQGLVLYNMNCSNYCFEKVSPPEHITFHVDCSNPEPHNPTYFLSVREQGLEYLGNFDGRNYFCCRNRDTAFHQASASSPPATGFNPEKVLQMTLQQTRQQFWVFVVLASIITGLLLWLSLSSPSRGDDFLLVTVAGAAWSLFSWIGAISSAKKIVTLRKEIASCLQEGTVPPKPAFSIPKNILHNESSRLHSLKYQLRSYMIASLIMFLVTSVGVYILINWITAPSSRETLDLIVSIIMIVISVFGILSSGKEIYLLRTKIRGIEKNK